MFVEAWSTMKASNYVSPYSDSKSRSCVCSLFIAVALICGVYFTGSAFMGKDFRMFPGFRLNSTVENTQHNKCTLVSGYVRDVNDASQVAQSNKCKEKCRPIGSEALPEGIVSKTSNLQMRPLWGPLAENNSLKNAAYLLAIAVGIKQKETVNLIVKKFLEDGFVVMLFHYDGVVDRWNDLEWNDCVIHVAAMNQTKWWFAKRFLHPDIIAEYDYVFLWDEDLGVENFHPGRYISIVKEEGLEISQPALDPSKSEVHHQITVRGRKSNVHRRVYKLKGSGRCYKNSTAPPCLGWVEMMAPVFSRAAWRCAWYMIQNDLIHAWGLDVQLGYCAQGDRAMKVGVVDAEYIVHMGLPTLGGASHGDKANSKSDDHLPQRKDTSDSEPLAHPAYTFDNRSAIRRESYLEMKIFKSRWNKAVVEDKCWVDPYEQYANQKIH